MTADDRELRPRSPTQRPASARPRPGAATPPTAGAEAESLDDPELDGIERHLALLPLHSGATGEDRPDLGCLLVRGEPPVTGPGYGAMVRWRDDDVADRLAALDAATRAHGGWPSLLVADGRSTPGDVSAVLTARGWSSLPSETVLWTRRPVTVPHLDPMLRLEAVTARSAAEHEALERTVFGLPPSSSAPRVAGMVRDVERGELRGFIVRSAGRPVAAARLSLLEGLAGLYGIGVAPDRRREGLGTFITAVAMRAGLAMGRPLVWLSVEDGNSAAAALYASLGFRPAFRWRRWLAPPR